VDVLCERNPLRNADPNGLVDQDSTRERAMHLTLRALTAASLAFIVTTAPALAGANDYAFEPVKVEVRNGPGSEVAVRLVDK
jgi:hypothetical protein